MDTTNWKWFRYDEIFDIKKGKRLTKADMEEGCIPYIGAIDSNNGISAYIANDSQLHEGNTISVSYNGSIGQAYFQEKSFWATDDVNVLYPKFSLNKYIAMFLISLIEKEKYRFCYGRKWHLEIMKASLIKLPVTSEGKPDWAYMEEFVKNTIIPLLPQRSRNVWNDCFDTTPEDTQKINLNTHTWKYFLVKDIFNVIPGRYHYDSEYDDGTTPYLSATSVNNGVSKYISLSPDFSGGAITTEKVQCTAFYHPDPFCATSDVNMLYRKDGIKINKYVGLFLSSIIDFNENFRWTYGRQCRKNDTEQIRIKLPAIPNADGTYTPDWQFMEDYIKSLPYSKNI